MQKKQLNFQVKELQDRSFKAVASTESLDRDAEKILSSAWDLEEYKRNPVILVNHDRHNLPCAKATSVGIVDKKLIVTGQFPPAGVSALSDTVHGLLKNQIIRSLSVGFLAKESPQIINGVRTYTSVQLLEISLVNIPANSEAMILAVKNYDPDEEFDLDEIEYIPETINIESIELDLETRIRYQQQREWSKELENVYIPVIRHFGK